MKRSVKPRGCGPKCCAKAAILQKKYATNPSSLPKTVIEGLEHASINYGFGTMLLNRFSLVLFLCLMLPGAAAYAQQAEAPFGEKSADQIFDDATTAYADEDYQRALDLLDLAALKESQPRFTYQRILVLEAMGEHQRAFSLLEEHRKELAGQPGVGDLTALEQRLREAQVATSDDNLTSDGGVATPEESDYIAWTFIGSGALAVGGGVTFLLLAESELSEVRCSGIYPDSQRQDCGGVDAPTQLSRAEFDRRLEQVDSYRILGGSLLALGVLSASYGSYRLLSAESEPAPASEARSEARTLSFDAAPRLDGGLEVQMVWHF